MRTQTREVDGIPMNWIEIGEGPPVVLLHGVPTGPALWRHVMPRLEGVRALAWELVGYAGSIPAGRGRDLSVAAQARYLAAWLDALELKQVVLVGHDIGGGIAQLLAVAQPERVRGLLLVDSISHGSWPIVSVRAIRSFGGLVRRLPPGLVAPLVRRLLWRGHRDRLGARESFAVHFPPYRRAGAGEALVAQLRALDADDTAPTLALPQLGIPTRLVWGGHDPFQKLRRGERLGTSLHAPIDVVAEARHFVPEDSPERVVVALEGLLNDLAGEEEYDYFHALEQRRRDEERPRAT